MVERMNGFVVDFELLLNVNAKLIKLLALPF